MLEALKTMNGATRLYGESAVTAAPMFEHAGRNGKEYWGDKEARGPMVALWDSLTDEGKKECLEGLKTTNDWVIWRKDSRKGDEDLMSYLTEVGREEFRGRAVRGQEEQKGTSGEETPLQGRAQKGRGWWRRGDAGAYLNGNGMKCGWVHKDMYARSARRGDAGCARCVGQCNGERYVYHRLDGAGKRLLDGERGRNARLLLV